MAQVQQTIQTRIAPFGLSDPTKPGHRKMLALFLIDPCRRIISTANVPCQQKYIWADQVRNTEPLSSLPAELADQIVNVRRSSEVTLREEMINSMETVRVWLPRPGRGRKGSKLRAYGGENRIVRFQRLRPLFINF